jgi:hypothetical protein
MGSKITIYGLEISLPDQPKPKDIAGYGLKTSKQKFQRVDLGDEYYEPDFDSEGMPIYSEEQQRVIKRELDRCEDGYWFYNNGVPTYITGDFYYYLNFWVLENGQRPDYRDADRRWFLFYKECKNDPEILGIIRVKKRREGATNQAACLLVKSASTGYDIRCGIISKTGGDAADLFTNMVVRGFRELPPFLQPRSSSDEETKKKLVFMKQGAKKKQGVHVVKKREGLNSFIEWRNTAPNSFDSGRWSVMLVDEAGKMEMDIEAYWDVLKKVLTEGAEKVGFALVISTVNPPNLGGDQYKALWDKSNQFAKGRDTDSLLVRYFTPAWDGFKGHIDEYGMSIKESAAEYIERKLRGSEQDMRDYPFSEDEAFRFAQSESPFNIENIDAQLQWLKDNPQFIRTGRLIWGEGDKVEFVDDAKGNWHIYKIPQQTNRWVKNSSGFIPGNTHNYVGGVDPFRLNTKGSYSSPGVIHIFEHLDATKPDNSCMPVAFYKGRPKEKDLFFEEAMKGFLFYGCKGTFEMDATDDYISYFQRRFAINLLNYTPDEAVNRHSKSRKTKIERGVRSADPFQLEKQLKVAVNFIEHHCHKIMFPSLLEDLKKYQHENRTERDETIALMMSLLSALGTDKGRQVEKKRGSFVETYSVNLFKP